MLPAPTIELLTVEDAAQALKVSQATVYRLIYAGELKVIRIGRLVRIKRSELASYVSRLEEFDG